MTARGTNSDEVRCSVKLDAFEKAVGADPPDPAATAAVRDHRERAAHERAARLAYDADTAARRRRLAQPVEYTLLGGRLTDEQLTRLRNDDADLVAQRAAHRPAPAPWTRSDPARPGLHIDSATMTKGPPFDAGSNRERGPNPQWVDAQPEGDFHLHVLSIGETHDTGFIWLTTNFLAPQDGQARFSATLNFSVSRTIDTSYAPPAGQSLRTDLDVYDISAPYGPSGYPGAGTYVGDLTWSLTSDTQGSWSGQTEGALIWPATANHWYQVMIFSDAWANSQKGLLSSLSEIDLRGQVRDMTMRIF